VRGGEDGTGSVAWERSAREEGSREAACACEEGAVHCGRRCVGSCGGGGGVVLNCGCGCGCGIVRGAATWALASSSANRGSFGFRSRLCSKLGLGIAIYDMLLSTTYCYHYLHGYYLLLPLLHGIIHRWTIKHYPLGFGSRAPAMQLCTKVLQTEESNLAMHPHSFPCLSLSSFFVQVAFLSSDAMKHNPSLVLSRP
jgi:hypothetical protein